MDIGSAFTFAFDDQEWVKKLAIGGALVLGGAFFLPIIVGIGLLVLVNGYWLDTMKNVRDGQTTPLPQWTDFGGLFSKGWPVTIIYIVYFLPVGLFYCASLGTSLGFAAIDPDLADTLTIATYCLFCLQALFFLIGYVLVPVAIIRYAQYETLGAAFQFGEMFAFVKENFGDYIIVVLLGIVVGVLASMGFILCGIGLFFTKFWSDLVAANLYGQLARKMTV